MLPVIVQATTLANASTHTDGVSWSREGVPWMDVLEFVLSRWKGMYSTVFTISSNMASCSYGSSGMGGARSVISTALENWEVRMDKMVAMEFVARSWSMVMTR